MLFLPMRQSPLRPFPRPIAPPTRRCWWWTTKRACAASSAVPWPCAAGRCKVPAARRRGRLCSAPRPST